MLRVRNDADVTVHTQAVQCVCVPADAHPLMHASMSADWPLLLLWLMQRFLARDRPCDSTAASRMACTMRVWPLAAGHREGNKFVHSNNLWASEQTGGCRACCVCCDHS